MTWAEPLALTLLGLPLLLLLLARRPARPRLQATGTLAIWKRVAEAADPDRGRARRVWPAWLLLAALASAIGALALAGPGPRSRPAPRLWTVVVDRSASMGLPVDPAQPRASRLARAVQAGRAQLAEWVRPGDRIEWIAVGRPPLRMEPGEQPPDAWLAPARTARGGAPRWERFALPGHVWVTDRAPRAAPGPASVITSGGAAVAGPVAAVGDEVLHWEVDGSSSVAPRAPSAVVLVEHATADGPSRIPGLLEGLIRSWARARGLSSVRTVVVDGGAPTPEQEGEWRRADVVLVVEAAPDGGPTRPFRLREPGIDWEGTVVADERAGAWPGPPAEGPPSVRWSAGVDDDSLPLLSASPGWVRLHVRASDPPAGDAPAFAVRFGGLLDAALLSPPGVVPRAARTAAGEAVVVRGDPPSTEREAARGASGTLRATGAAAAALLAFLAFWTRRSASL